VAVDVQMLDPHGNANDLSRPNFLVEVTWRVVDLSFLSDKPSPISRVGGLTLMPVVFVHGVAHSSGVGQQHGKQY
jgi:hypothetical protein